MITRAVLISRWIERAKGAALLGTLAVGIASGYAFAISPTVDSGRNFVGSINIVETTSAFSYVSVYTVPAGKQYTITDVILTDLGDSGSEAFIDIASDGLCSGGLANRLGTVQVPDGGTLHLPLVTGLGFGPGKTVCLVSFAPVRWTVRGYLSSAT